MVRWLWRIGLLASALVLLLSALAWWLLRGSLPALDGELALAGLSTPVQVHRDALGVVTIDARNEIDAMRALGWVHAQERYFEMDLLRRTSAGELSALFGEVALDADRRHRVHRMRARVESRLDAIAGERLPQLRAYADGANAGLAALRARPWPYLLLRQRPAPWEPADSVLAAHAMYFDLQDGANADELALWQLRPHLPAALYALLTHPGSDWDAPLQGEPFGDAPLPSADEVDLRKLPAPGPDSDPVAHARPSPSRAAPAWDGYLPGSNNFAVSGALTVDGRAIVADDMHLSLRVPNIWFRARLRWPDPAAPGGQVDVQGVTLPGLPVVIAGSNGHVGWGYTNSYGDYADWALETPCPDAAARADAAACAPVQLYREHIEVAGGEPHALAVRETAWGPVLDELDDGRLLSLRWTAHLPNAVNLGLAGLAGVDNLDAALALADRTAIPTQNLVIGDSGGRIAWRLLGPLPVRAAGCSPTAPAPPPASAQASAPSRPPALAPTVAPGPADAVAVAVAVAVAPASASAPLPESASASTSASAPAPGDATAPMAGRTAAAACPPWPTATDASPIAASPEFDRLWTANARTTSGNELARIGDGGYNLGARARQIRDALHARDRFTEADLLAIQLDDRALLLTRWWQLLRSLDDGASPALQALAVATHDWSGHAGVDSAGYRIVREWRRAVHRRLLEGLLAPAQTAMGERFARPSLRQFEGVAWPLVQQRPEHLLPKRYASWTELFEDAAVEVRDGLSARGPLHERSWGEANTASICHPLAGAIPLGRRLLCMPAVPLPGDSNLPRVQGPSFGASQRMVVAPGHEADGILHMPGGQSGHPLSPFWGAGHEDWVHGRPTPFPPGPGRHVLLLRP